MTELSGPALEAILMAIPAGVIVIEKENGKVGKFSFVNERAMKLCGVNPPGQNTPNPLTGMNLFTLEGEPFPPDKFPARQSLLTGTEEKDNLVVECSDGSRIVISVSARPVRDEKGSVVAAVAIIEDVTERILVDEALRDSEERFRLVAEAAKVLVYEVDVTKSKLVICRGEEVLGYKSGEIPLAKEWWMQQIHPDDRDAITDKLSQAIQSGKDVLLEYRVKHNQDGYIIVHDTAKMIKNEQGKVIRVVGGVRDVTQRKKEEEALVESEERFKSLVESTSDWIWQVDENGAYTYAGPKIKEILGYSPQEVLGKTPFDLMPKDESEKIGKIFKKIAENKTPFQNLENLNIHKNGNMVLLETSGVPILDKNGKLVGYRGIDRDITERKKLQAQIEKYAENLEKLVEERTKQLQDKERLATIGQTAGMVGHDIRNPLQAMLSDVYLIKSDLAAMPEGQTKEGAAESLKSIEQNIAYISKIVADLQDYARPLMPEWEEVDLSELIARVFDTVIVPDNVVLRVDVKGSLRLKTDPTFVRRALTNLVNNAVQAMPDSGELGITAHRKDNSITVTVSDTGKGIPEDVKPNLFKPLFTTKSKGQGLGLAVVKRLVEALNGKVRFESQEGKGTQFTVEFPITA